VSSPRPRRQDPRELLRLSRRLEIAGGVVALVVAALTWSGEWWSWVLVAVGVLGLSPWPGPATVLRNAETRPEILESDPERGRRRARHSLMIMLPVATVIGMAVGYAADGASGALAVGGLMLLGAALSVAASGARRRAG
jgi:hypothetical protein